LLKTLDERIASGDAGGTARLVQSLSAALLTHSYRTNLADWEGEEQSPIGLAKGCRSGEQLHRTVLISKSGSDPARPAACRNWHKRYASAQTTGQVYYEPVFRRSFEDAVLATILNGSLEAVMIYEVFPSLHRTTVQFCVRF